MSDSNQQNPQGLLCVRCGYDLTGLSGEGVCPECSVPLATSAFGSPLILADHRPLRRAIVGCAMIAASVIGVATIVVLLLLSDHLSGAEALVLRLATAIVLSLYLFVSLLGTGTFLAAPRLQGSARFAPYNRSALIARIVATVLAVAGGSGIVLTIGTHVLFIDMPAILVIANPVAMFAIPLAFIASMLAFSSLASLLSRPDIARACRNAAITIPILTLILAFMIIGFFLPAVAWTIGAVAMLIALRSHLRQRAAFESRHA